MSRRGSKSLMVQWLKNHFNKTGLKKPHARLTRFPVYSINNEKGSAIVMALIFMVLATTLMVTAAQLVTTMRKNTNEQSFALAMAENAAQAGLEDAIGWFGRQPVQPVAGGATSTVSIGYPLIYNSMAVTYADQVFSPVYNISNPATTDSIDPSGASVTNNWVSNSLTNEFSPDGAGSVSNATTIGDQRYWERYQVLSSCLLPSLTIFPVPSSTGSTISRATGSIIPSTATAWFGRSIPPVTLITGGTSPKAFPPLIIGTSLITKPPIKCWPRRAWPPRYAGCPPTCLGT